VSYRLGTVNDFHWGFKPVLSYSKPHIFLEEKMKRICINSLQSGHLEAEQNNSKVKRSDIQRKGLKKRKFQTKYKRLLPVKIIVAESPRLDKINGKVIN